MSRILLVLALLLPAALCAAAQEHAPTASPTHEYTLKNGMNLVVREDHRAPVVVSQIWYRVGSSDEHSGITGISHVLEHMMFKGTERYGPGEFSRIISRNGGRENAFTGQDYTAYFQQLEKSRLAISFKLEADRMRNLRLDEKEFAKEIKVVMEERRLRTDNDPQALTYERFNAAAFINGPYHHPIIGWMNDLRNLDVAELARWYRKWYAPNNATLVVAGDVDPDDVYKLARKYFARIKPSRIEPSKPRREIPTDGTRRITVRAPAELPYLIMGYQVPTLVTADEDWEPYALEVLAAILDGGDSARLARRLIRGSQVAASASAGYDLLARYDSLLLLDGTPASGQDSASLEQALREQIASLRDTPVSGDELERVKAQVIASRVYERDSIFYQAMQIGMLETVGLGWRVMDDYLARIQDITAAQVMQVARKYLHDDNLTIAVLAPQPVATAPSGQGGGHHGH